VSVKIMARVWELDLPLRDKFVLLGFADHADDDGHCFPSMARIAWKCGLSRATVKRSVKVLLGTGILVRPKGYKLGRSAKTLYTIRCDKGVKLPPFTSKWVSEREKGSSETVKGVTAMTPESSLQPSYKPKPRASRASRNSFDEEMEQRRKLQAKTRRETQEDDLRREIFVGQPPI
jgi:Helix-turn-helix domain